MIVQAMVAPSLAGPSGIRDGDAAVWGYEAVRHWDGGTNATEAAGRTFGNGGNEEGS